MLEAEKRIVDGKTVYWVKLGQHFVRFTEEDAKTVYEYFKGELHGKARNN